MTPSSLSALREWAELHEPKGLVQARQVLELLEAYERSQIISEARLRDWGKLESASRWQPIATAPKDGTDVLVWKDMASVPVVHIAFYRGRKEWEESGQHTGFCDTLEEWEGWWSYTENSVSQSKLEDYAAPTHWMPYHPPGEGA